MSIDLDTTEGRKQYLADKLDDLMDGINESYGTVLMEELLNRLELTIRDFSQEMKILCNQLVKKQEERQNLLEILRTREGSISQVLNKKTSTSSENEPKSLISHESSEKLDKDIPSWEKKLAKLEKK